MAIHKAIAASGYDTEKVAGSEEAYKNLPGCLMGMIRINRPSLMIYGGSMMPGKYKGQQVDIVNAF